MSDMSVGGNDDMFSKALDDFFKDIDLEEDYGVAELEEAAKPKLITRRPSDRSITALHQSPDQFDTVVDYARAGNQEYRRSLIHSLYKAIAAGDTKAAQGYITTGAKIAYKKPGWAETPLVQALNNEDEDMVRLLVQNGANLEEKDWHGHSLLGRMVTAKKPKMVKLILALGADSNAANQWKETALLEAAKIGDLESMQALLEHSADANAPDTWGERPLNIAVRKNNLDMLQLLLKYNANPMHGSHWGSRSAFMQAVTANRAKALQAFIDKGYQFDFPIWNKQTPLYFAFEKGAFDSAKTLIAAGANIHAANTWGYTVFGDFMSKNPEEWLEFIKRGEIEYSKLDGQSLSKAAESYAKLDDEELLIKLVDAGANIAYPASWHSLSPIQIIAQNHKAEIVAAVIERAINHGADLTNGRFNELVLTETNFANAKLAQSTWKAANLAGSSFTNSNLENSSFYRAQLYMANLSNANLQNVDFSYSDLRGAHLFGAKLQGANFKGAILEGAYIAMLDIVNNGLDPQFFKDKGVHITQ